MVSIKCTSLEEKLCAINQTYIFIPYLNPNTLSYTSDILSRSPNPKVTVCLSRKPVLCGKEHLHHLPLWVWLMGLIQEDISIYWKDVDYSKHVPALNYHIWRKEREKQSEVPQIRLWRFLTATKRNLVWIWKQTWRNVCEFKKN